MNNILPIHQRMAELWIKNQARELTKKEMDEMYLCMKKNAAHCYEMAYLENLSVMASMTNDMDWLYEICRDIETL